MVAGTQLYDAICVRGIRDENYDPNTDSTNTCPGDSGGGLLCYPQDSKKYYLMGVLHGGPKPCHKQNLMYFNNMAHPNYKDVIESPFDDE